MQASKSGEIMALRLYSPVEFHVLIADVLQEPAPGHISGWGVAGVPSHSLPKT